MGVVGCERTLSADNVRSRADVIGSRVMIPPITCVRKYVMGHIVKYLETPYKDHQDMECSFSARNTHNARLHNTNTNEHIRQEILRQ